MLLIKHKRIREQKFQKILFSLDPTVGSPTSCVFVCTCYFPMFGGMNCLMALFFCDGDNDMENRVEGLALKHFRSCSLVEVQKQPSMHWKYIIENDIKLPTNMLRVFDENGDFVHAINFESASSHSVVDDDSFIIPIPIQVPLQPYSPSINATPNQEPLTSTPLSTHTTPRRQLLCETEDNYKIINELDKTPCSSSSAKDQYISSHAQLISTIIGDCCELSKFDTLHMHIKSSNGNTEKSKLLEY